MSDDHFHEIQALRAKLESVTVERDTAVTRARAAVDAFGVYSAHCWEVHKRDCPGCNGQDDASFCPNEIGDEWVALGNAMRALEQLRGQGTP